MNNTKGYLSLEELQQLDKEIDQKIPNLELLKTERSLAVFHLICVFEIYINRVSQGKQEALLNYHNALNTALKWIYQFCPINGSTYQFELQDKIIEQTVALFESAAEYTDISEFMFMLFKSRLGGVRNKLNQINLEEINVVDDDIDIASKFIALPDEPDGLAEIKLVAASQILQDTFSKINIKSTNKKKLEYNFSPNVFNKISEEVVEKLLSPVWELDPTQYFEKYSVGEFKKFWLTILTMIQIRYWAYVHSGKDIKQVLFILNEDRWVNEISKFSGLAEITVAAILKDLTYDPQIYNKAGSSAKEQPLYQPFHRLRDKIIVLSSGAALLSNPERNFWALLNIRNPKLHSIIRNKKERFWIHSLEEFFQKKGFFTKNNITFTIDDEHGEIDLLVVDLANKHIINFQLKWFTSPGRITDVYKIDQELEAAEKKAIIANNWLLSKPESLRQFIQKTESELETYKIDSIILSKNSIGSSWRKSTLIPVINERLLYWILDEPHFKDLKTLLYVATNKTYYPVKKIHYNNFNSKAHFQGYTFFGENLGIAKTDTPWSPQDIKLS